MTIIEIIFNKCVLYCLEIDGMQLIIKLSLEHIQYLQMSHWTNFILNVDYQIIVEWNFVMSA